ncbi:redoxin domain-containing protein [Peptostreptococcus russellii]|uniref:cytochrome c biogenesis protein/redoxin n=1 Tax=Peptostreptococcus russellii TaxID=215200 RepID=UPI001629659B|nr:cytochrome c biogenesis protein CcdA [Peptostreptococcus russellii]MBC2578548.1 redoxin domain-containing protein [Peptostreptococcus russellii]
MNSLGLSSSINFAMVFTEGLVSFFSPCVIPLIPLYMGYLAGGAKEKDADGTIKYGRKTVLLHTIFFILGISVAFFILGLGFSSLGSVLKEYRDVLSKVGGAIIIILGLNQLGLFKIKFLNKQFRMTSKASTKKMNPLVAFVMGFGFSFAWTPCVGPALASVLILASNAKSVLEGNLLVVVYILGFLIPFVLLGLFTGETLNFIKKNPKIMNGIVKLGAVILIVMGAMLMFGTLDKFEAKLSGTSSTQESIEAQTDESSKEKEAKETEDSSQSEDGDPSQDERQMMLPIELKDQNGNTVNIEKDFKGKVVFLNFFATWCPPCKQEIPDIEKLYEDNGFNKKDVAVIAVASPGQGREQDEAGVKKFIDEMGIKYPVLMDTTGEVFGKYQVYSLPTTFLIDKEGKIYGYVTGGITRDVMDKAVNETKNLK